MSNVVKSTFRLGPVILLMLSILLCFIACMGYIALLSGSEEALSWVELLFVNFLILVCCFVLWGLLVIRYRVIVDPLRRCAISYHLLSPHGREFMLADYIGYSIRYVSPGHYGGSGSLLYLIAPDGILTYLITTTNYRNAAELEEALQLPRMMYSKSRCGFRLKPFGFYRKAENPVPFKVPKSYR